MIVVDDPTTYYFFPEDSAIGQAAFLGMLHNPEETWIIAFNFSLSTLFDEIKAADANGIKIHMLLDHSQYTTPSEKQKVLDLFAVLKNSDITIGTAGPGSARPSMIIHDKMMVVGTPPRSPDFESYCWTGSWNFSASASDQMNIAADFHSDQWAAYAVNQFNIHRDWSLQHEPQYQLTRSTSGTLPVSS